MHDLNTQFRSHTDPQGHLKVCSEEGQGQNTRGGNKAKCCDWACTDYHEAARARDSNRDSRYGMTHTHTKKSKVKKV